MDHYAEVRNWKDRIEHILVPCQFRVGLVWALQGGVSMIWYWGRDETGFASGDSPESAADSAIRQVFGGL